MPRAVPVIPSYRLHRPSGRAVVTLQGKDIYLGLHGTPQSRADYDRLIQEWLANGRRVSMPASQTAQIPVAELLARYWEHVQIGIRRAGARPVTSTT